MSEVTQLDPLSFPLHGSRLIEASAGTGKTFTIALLYVRLVLGARSADDAAAFERPLTPPEILVVTFTNAATQELRERIRARLVEAANVFLSLQAPEAAPPQAPEAAPPQAPETKSDTAQASGAGCSGGPMPGMASVAPRDGFTAPPRNPADEAAHQSPDAGSTASAVTPPTAESQADPLLIALRNQYDPATWPACARRLQLAAEWMDEAAVSTIHSWCYRMLREHAFDSGSLFSLNLENDQTELELEVVRDYWRSFYYPLSVDELATVVRHWSTPEQLHAPVRGLMPEAEALNKNAPPPAETIANASRETAERLAQLKAPWPQWVNECEALFEEAAQQKAFKGQSFNARSRANWLGALREWCQGEATWPGLTDAAWKRLTPRGMADIWLKGEPPDHPALAALEKLQDELNALPDPYADLLTHAVHWCRARLDREQERRAEMGPNELLTHLDRALTGPNCEALGAQIRRQFPVALVDEFQDTDPVQYRIFDCVYRIRENRPECGVFLIGDPKQAIYAFRGADIYTYLRARRDTQGRHVTLGTNFRSSREMVEAVNRCFEFAEAHPPGAFLFNSPVGNPVPFLPVGAKGRKDSLTRQGQPLPAMTLWQLECDEPLSKTAYQQEMAERCASTMVELLNEGQSGSAGFQNEQGELQPLKPSDMAVLVNGLGEARSIRQALARRGVKSVYLSDKDKVFASPVAPQLDAWLRACAAPDDDRLLRTALATSVLGLDIATLDRLNEDELAWEGRVLQFRDYHRLWQRQGVLPLVRKIIHDFDVAQRLLAWGPASDGERVLTDLLHLGELLQHASQELDGEHALIRFLAEAIANPEGHGDTHKLRLESDADLVQVITIHKSKGLEYPLVFLPFICNHRATKKDDSPLRWHDAEGRLRISLEADDETLATVDRERLGEDLRKLYVALTRARHATWLGMAPLKGGEGSAIGQLLANGDLLGPTAFSQAVSRLKGNCDAIEIAPAPPAHAEIVRQAERDDALGEARTPTRPAREHWWIASYSALRLSGEIVSVESASAPVRTDSPVKPHDSEAQRSGSLPEPATAMEATALEVLEEPRDSGQSEPLPSLHRFPRGPGPGTFLHGILEWAGEQGFARVARDPALREDTLARRCQVRGWQPWLNTLNAWFGTLLAAPLPLPNGAGSLRLEALSRYQVEMEFWFASRQVDTRRLDALVSAYTLPSTPRPALDADTLNGMLKGFIDLVFEHEGRYYVADWKSNHLGPDDSAYSQEAMRQAVAAKRYDLQYALYLLALHRLLKARLPGYDYDRHIGGSLTVFLRGANAESRGVHAERPPRELIEALDALFQGDARAAGTRTTTEAPA
ncbi:exodeoxyribonuclease V subunit beta [Billgrantia kenyensis]|uniref:RecBCD enzyme subunit RecB n=1 Tax=Billgrantia kenyensis TaxID=321266 RepID=A0A7V9W0W1_9GAMM|nr:exodeoxyribonuclease V subunit beta [Halomonas kenyensis]MBA2779013.1 exodeoxyribonuclease V subunit beta [Halomonas kenyensis]MCG6660440.1 exodeoxyribonuclease V subunit beta [Halomonas kenyensis]